MSIIAPHNAIGSNDGYQDLDDIMIIMEDSFDPRFGEGWSRPQCIGIMSDRNSWMALARQDDQPGGFALSRMIADEAELLLIAVRPAFRGKGIGRDLLQRVSRAAATKGAKRLRLEVRDGNTAANLYSDAGFERIGRRRNYYSGRNGDHFDAITLALQIRSPCHAKSASKSGSTANRHADFVQKVCFRGSSVEGGPGMIDCCIDFCAESLFWVSDAVWDTGGPHLPNEPASARGGQVTGSDPRHRAHGPDLVLLLKTAVYGSNIGRPFSRIALPLFRPLTDSCVHMSAFSLLISAPQTISKCYAAMHHMRLTWLGVLTKRAVPWQGRFASMRVRPLLANRSKHGGERNRAGFLRRRGFAASVAGRAIAGRAARRRNPVRHAQQGSRKGLCPRE